jgi:hypothetical protein
MIIEKKVMKFIPSHCQHRIKTIFVLENGEYSQELRKYRNVYIAKLNDNYTTADGDTEVKSTSIGRLVYLLSNEVIYNN